MPQTQNDMRDKKIKDVLKKSEENRKKREQALYDLRKMGVLIPFDSRMHLYHGRANLNYKKFVVQPKFNNAGNATGNRNVNGVAGLHTSNYDVAQGFATARVEKFNKKNLKGMPEVHQIIASAPNCYFLSLSSIRDEEKEKISSAFTQLMSTYKISEILPFKFEMREYGDAVLDKIIEFRNAKKSHLLTEDDINSLYSQVKSLGVSKKDFEELAANCNTAALSHTVDFRFLLDRFVNGESEDSKNFFTVGQNKYPMNMEYVVALCDKIGVIGTFAHVDSATLNHEIIDDYFVFETDKVNTKAFVEKQEQKKQNMYGKLSEKLEYCVEDKEDFDFLLNSSPEETMAFIQSKIPQTQKYYQKSAKVWEGFSVAEHTESALRVFEDSFSNSGLPEMVPFLKLTIAMHDIGKGQAREQGIFDKKKEMEITKHLTEKAMGALGMDKKQIELMQYIIADSQDFTTDFYINKNEQALQTWAHSSINMLKHFFGNEPKVEQVEGLMRMAEVLQTCDSGAYTRMGVTRDKETGFYYFNGNDRFTQSMQEPKDLRGRKQKLEPPKKNSGKVA